VKSIANYISISRIFFALSLAFVKPLSFAFVAIYLICGISDILDGYIARKTNTTSKLGSQLDSVADLIMVVVLIIILSPIISLTTQTIVWIAIIAIIRTVSILVVLIKYRTVEILHTYGNKITGLSLFVFPLSLEFFQSDVLIDVICMIASISALEELYIHLTSTKLQTNTKNIFIKSH